MKKSGKNSEEIKETLRTNFGNILAKIFYYFRGKFKNAYEKL